VADLDVTAIVRDALADNNALAQQLTDPHRVAAVATVADLLVEAYRAGGKLLVFGNGGSAADAAHLAAEFVGRCNRDRRALPAINLSDNTAAVTAIANDYGYEQVFARQVRAFAVAGDVVIGLTASGRSRNVVLGLEAARTLGAVTVALCGAYDDALQTVSDHCLAVPSTSTGRVQEAHLLWGHVWADAVERSLDEA
jgi:D-sedoheptulose 7-phosphate isomerase